MNFNDGEWIFFSAQWIYLAQYSILSFLLSCSEISDLWLITPNSVLPFQGASYSFPSKFLFFFSCFRHRRNKRITFDSIPDEVASSISNWRTSSWDSPDRKFLMKVTREDTKVTERSTEREESPVISDILLQRGVRSSRSSPPHRATTPRSIKASASAENFYMNGFHYVADLLRASSRGH